MILWFAQNAKGVCRIIRSTKSMFVIIAMITKPITTRNNTLFPKGRIVNIDSFEKAFNTSSGSCCLVCECGKVFYNDTFDSGWDWEDGELEELQNNPDATNLDWSVGGVIFGGTEYVIDCNCWHEKAKDFMDFLDKNKNSIAEYFKQEKKRLLGESNAIPDIK